jgi:hypothetical protein
VFKDGQVVVYLSNGQKYIYDHVNLKQWKMLPEVISELDNTLAENPVIVEPNLSRYETN